MLPMVIWILSKVFILLWMLMFKNLFEHSHDSLFMPFIFMKQKKDGTATLSCFGIM